MLTEDQKKSLKIIIIIIKGSSQHKNEMVFLVEHSQAQPT